MPYKCSVSGCRTNYKNNSSDDKIALYKFPNPDSDQERLQKWIRKIPRSWSDQDISGLNRSGNSYRVCALHFDSTCIISESNDTNSTRKKKRASSFNPLSLKKLSSSAIPTIFPNLLSYLSESEMPTRGTSSSMSSRLAAEQNILDTSVNYFFDKDKIASIADMKEYVLPNHLSHYVKVMKDDNCYFHDIAISSDGIPQIVKSLCIGMDLNVSAVYDGVIQPSITEDIIRLSKLDSFNQLENLLSRLKNVQGDLEHDYQHHIMKVIPHIDQAIYAAEQSDNEKVYSKLSFLLEQFHLITMRKPNYSSELLSLSYLLFNHSASAYRFVQDSDCLTLPSARHLQRLSSNMSASMCDDSLISYLKLKSDQLTTKEKLVIVNIDEIHSSKKLEFSGGQCFGIECHSNAIARTVCTVLIKSICTKYQEVIMMEPSQKLDTSKLHNLLMKSLRLLHNSGFIPVVISVDNHPVNRSLFETVLCDGELKTHIVNPVNGEKLFLLFDPVHNFKNIYNNWCTRGVFKFPDMHDNSKFHIADFSDLIDLYTTEVGNPSDLILFCYKS